MGCDDTEWGRQMNRRVELWVDPVVKAAPILESWPRGIFR